MALAQVRDQMDKYSLKNALDHLNKTCADDGTMRNLLQRDRSLQEVRSCPSEDPSPQNMCSGCNVCCIWGGLGVWGCSVALRCSQAWHMQAATVHASLQGEAVQFKETHRCLDCMMHVCLQQNGFVQVARVALS